jgi:phosphoglucomutase
MEQEMTKPFKTVTIEYFSELQETSVGMMERQVRVVTTTKQWVGSDKDPIVYTTFEYL